MLQLRRIPFECWALAPFCNHPLGYVPVNPELRSVLLVRHICVVGVISEIADHIVYNMETKMIEQ